MDPNIFITIAPPVLTAIFAYLVATRRSSTNEKVNKAKLDAQTQLQALNIVRDVMKDMRDSFQKENSELRDKIIENEIKIQSLETKVNYYNDLISSLRAEIQTLERTIKMYEFELERLKRQ